MLYLRRPAISVTIIALTALSNKIPDFLNPCPSSLTEQES